MASMSIQMLKTPRRTAGIMMHAQIPHATAPAAASSPLL
jgi:hypothetical protein